MNKYEIMFIVKPDVEEEARNTLIENFKSILTANGGSVDNVNEWGLRDFAYEIKDYTKGYYVVVDVTCAPAKSQNRTFIKNQRISITSLNSS